MEDGSPNDFYALCDGAHRELFSTIAHDWTERGLPREWQDGNLVLCVHTAGQHVPLFVLAVAGSAHRARLLLPLGVIRGALGEIEAQRLGQAIRDIHGLKSQQQDDVLAVLEPGHASGPIQQAMRDVINTLAVRLPNMLAR
ncbi:MAG: hypothetical protein R8K46_00710 [Mariprofundaceae bacterium]